MEKQKHYAERIAYAEGKEIEYYDPVTKKWIHLPGEPIRFPDTEYRVKRGPKKDLVFTFNKIMGHGGSTAFIFEPGTFQLTIDGETGNLKHIEILKKDSRQ